MQRRVLRAFRRSEILDDAAVADMLDWQATGGFSVDASVRIEADDPAGVERLVRYCARPPFALERLHAVHGPAVLASEDARLVYRLPEPDLLGRSELVLSPIELLERISRLIPPPRVHRHRYHGVLLARIYEVLPLLCPACGGPMRIIAFLTDPPVVRTVLIHLGLPDRPPPIAPARGPPQAEIEFDQTPGYDPAEADPGPDFEFDQSLPEELEF